MFNLLDEVNALKLADEDTLNDTKQFVNAFEYSLGYIMQYKYWRGSESLRDLIKANDPLCQTTYYQVIRVFVDSLDMLYMNDVLFKTKIEDLSIYKDYVAAKTLISDSGKQTKNGSDHSFLDDLEDST